MDWKSSALNRPTAAVSTMTSAGSTISMRCRTWSTTPVRDSLVAGFHCFSTVGLISADATEAGFLRGCFGA